MKEGIIIEKSCTESWDEMLPASGEQVCTADSPATHNLAALNTAQLQNFIRANWGKKVSKAKVEQVLVTISQRTFFRRRDFIHSFVLALFLAFGSTLLAATTINERKADFKISLETIDPSQHHEIPETEFIYGKLAFQEKFSRIESPETDSTDESNVTVYTNPFAQFIRIRINPSGKLQKPQLSIHRIDGKPVEWIDTKLDTQSGTSLMIPTSSWERGWYSVTILDNGVAVQTEKVLIR